jgi:hypothetical protein
LPIEGRYGLVEKRQVEVGDIDNFVFGVAALLGKSVNPMGYGVGLAAGTCASYNDCDLQHGALPSISSIRLPHFAV